MTPEDLHLMVGEIRSDVKTLLARSDLTEKRIGNLEKWRWYNSGFAAAVAFIMTKFGMPGQ